MSIVVYKSSAGSGKTTTLVNEYLKIALNQPGSFRHILAITFTNKAANEMKTRVIETLKELIDDKKPPSKKLTALIDELNLDIWIIKARAKKLLYLILHNYDEFAISTIDSFIHRVIRTFAIDLHLPQNFDVVIDNDDIIPHIVQSLYDKVGNDAELTKILIDFVLNQADEENSFDPTSKFIQFIKHHMQEDGFDQINKLNNLSLDELNKIISRLKNKISTIKTKIIKSASAALSLCNTNNLVEKDFFQGSRGIMAYFNKVSLFKVDDDKLFPGSIVQKTINDDSWFTKKTETSIQNSILEIAPELTLYYNEIVDNLKDFLYLRLIYSKIYSLALIHEIRSLFVGYTEDTGKVHISEFNKKISNEIAYQPVPFIYERLGRKYRYFLIDEFQDTSVLQWNNLLPLIEESLSYGNFNMLVGDAKQAIYRFRNGEVELFSSLPNLYKNDGSQLALTRQSLINQEYEEVILSTNWRSYSEIIKFNNDFFRRITDHLTDKTKKIYHELEQKIPVDGKQGGLVSINFVEIDNAEDFHKKKVKKIQEFVVTLLEKKILSKDICILCRSKKSTIDIASYLIENGYNVVSSESLLLTNSSKVRLVISFFKLLLFPENELAIAEFIHNYNSLKNNSKFFNKDFQSYRNNSKKGIDFILSHYHIEAKASDLLALTTYEIAEFVLRVVINDSSADIFVQYLLDFIAESSLPLDVFISRWEEKAEKLFITMSEDMDAIKIMTIHKAKGLDFKAVIVEASNTKNQNTKNEYWEDLEIDDLDELKVALLPLNKKLEYIHKSDIFEAEVGSTELDFLNLMYVAFTRPVIALFTVGQLQNGSSKDTFSKYLINYLKTKGIWDEKILSYSFGELDLQEEKKSTDTSEPLILKEFISSDWTKLVKVAPTDELTSEVILGKSSRSYGKLIHKILSEIETHNQADAVFNNVRESGILSDSDISIIEDIVVGIITHPKLNKYYQNNIIIKNETEVLLKDGDIVRPDRVVIIDDILTIIDYKTGEEKKSDYEQVSRYRYVFSKLGYTKIDAILIYIGEMIRVVKID